MNAKNTVTISEQDVTHEAIDDQYLLLERQFKGLLELMPDAIVVVNGNGRIVYCNDQALTLFGYQRSSMLGIPLDQLMPERFRSRHVRHRLSYQTKPRPRPMGAGLELFGLRSNGVEFPVEISLSPLDADGESFVVSAIRDATARRKAEQKFRDLLESAPDAIVIVNRSGTIVLVNSQTERLFGYSRGELIGESVERLVPRSSREAHRSHREKYVHDPRVREMGSGLELFGVRKDSTEFPVEISLSPLETEDGVLISSSIRDLTDRKKLEELRRRDLEEQNRTIQAANRMKSEFLANMSHELRTPLNGIIGFSELLRDKKPGPLNTVQKEYVDNVLTAGRHLLQLINDVLDLAKIEAGKAELVMADFSLKEALREVSAVIGPILAKKRIVLTQRHEGAVDMLRGDRQKLLQILYNLLSNAAKFTPPHGAIGIVVRSRADDRLEIQVRDTGIGISADELPDLFKEFHQIDTGSHRQFQGTGLGLALTRRLVELFGGTIVVESTPGKGSVFSVELPGLLKHIE